MAYTLQRNNWIRRVCFMWYWCGIWIRCMTFTFYVKRLLRTVHRIQLHRLSLLNRLRLNQSSRKKRDVLGNAKNKLKKETTNESRGAAFLCFLFFTISNLFLFLCLSNKSPIHPPSLLLYEQRITHPPTLVYRPFTHIYVFELESPLVRYFTWKFFDFHFMWDETLDSKVNNCVRTFQVLYLVSILILLFLCHIMASKEAQVCLSITKLVWVYISLNGMW